MCLAVLLAGMSTLLIGAVLLALRRWDGRLIPRPPVKAWRFSLGLPPPRPPELSSPQVLRI
jgi:hypothetical protein